MKSCLNNGCKNMIKISSLDCPGQCLPCAIKARERVAAWFKWHNAKHTGKVEKKA